MPRRKTVRKSANLLLLLAALLLAGCPAGRVQAPPSVPGPPVRVEEGRASFFFPIEIPLAEVRRTIEESLPPRMSDERKQEIAEGLPGWWGRRRR